MKTIHVAALLAFFLIVALASSAFLQGQHMRDIEARFDQMNNRFDALEHELDVQDRRRSAQYGVLLREVRAGHE